jgi:hypothetical protein
MTYHISTLLRRDDPSWNPLSLDLLIILVAISFSSLLSISLIYAVRKYTAYKSSRRHSLPTHSARNVHCLNIHTPPYSRTSSIYYYDEKASPVSSAASSPCSPVPEIRITFPDDVDADGRQLKGRVVVVTVGEKGGVGLQPLRDEEQLPRYERDGKRWDELDMELIGGLREKREFV